MYPSEEGSCIFAGALHQLHMDGSAIGKMSRHSVKIRGMSVSEAPTII